MNAEAISKSTFGKLFIKVAVAGMESRFRYRFFGPANTLSGADILPGQVVLEVGCGTGFYTIPVACLIGDQGHLVAMDVLPDSVEQVSGKVQNAGLKNVQVIKGDALNTGLDTESFDVVLLFGVIPAPMLPLDKLLPEMHRVLKVNGVLAVWPPIPGLLQAILECKLFMYSGSRKGVHNFRRV